MSRPDTSLPTDTGATTVTSTTPRRVRRRLLACVVVAAVTTGAAVGLASAQLPGPEDPPQDAGAVLDPGAAGSTFSAIDAPKRPVDPLTFAGRPLEPEAADALSAMARLDRVRLVGERDGLRLYLAPGVRGDAVCIIVIGTTDDTFSANCPPRRIAMSGQAVLGVRGGPGRDWTFVGIAPDAVAGVRDETSTVAVTDNTFVLTRNGTAPASLRYRLRSGAERVARPPR